MKKIRNIAVGIDFSLPSINAYHYALALAKKIGAELTLVHVKRDSSITSDVIISSFPPDNNDRLIKKIRGLINEDPETTKLSATKIKILTGDVVTVFTELPENTGTDLIVLGNNGLSNVVTKLFGSTALKISNRTHCPVMLVPREAQWQDLKQLLFASDYDSMSSIFVTKITDFATNVHANIHFVNVRNYDPILEPKQKDINWNGLLTGNTSNLDYKKSTIYGNDTVEELKKYSEANNIDLIAFASKHRIFWTDLTHKSTTSKMALSTTVPLMVMHLDDEVQF